MFVALIIIQVALLILWTLLKLYTLWFSKSKFLSKDEYPLLVSWLFLKFLESYTKSVNILIFENIVLVLILYKAAFPKSQQRGEKISQAKSNLSKKSN